MNSVTLNGIKIFVGDIIHRSAFGIKSYAVTKIKETFITLTLDDRDYEIPIDQLEQWIKDGTYIVFSPSRPSVKRFIVTAVDTGDSCDGKARVIGTFQTRGEAKNYVNDEIKVWIDDRAGQGVECDFDRMTANYIDDSNTGCTWNIEDVSIEL